MPIHFRAVTEEYETTDMVTMRGQVKDAEFMLAAFRRAQISPDLFLRYAEKYLGDMNLRMSNMILEEVYSNDLEERREAEELVNRNERICEQLYAAKKATGRFFGEPELKPGIAERLIQAEVYRRTEDPNLRVFYPLPALD